MSDWKQVIAVADIPVLGSRVINSPSGNIAVFRTADDEIFALRDKCPHRGGPLSQGMIVGKSVACPLHNWHISLENGQALEPDEGCAGYFPVRVEQGLVYLNVEDEQLADF